MTALVAGRLLCSPVVCVDDADCPQAFTVLAVVKLEVHKHKQETENVHLQSKRYVFKGKQSPLA